MSSKQSGPSPAHEAPSRHANAGHAPPSSSSSYPDLDLELASPTDSVIAGDFGAMSPEEQERQREDWKDELRKTEEEILTLKQVLASKEVHAAGLKRRLGITAWREFSEDMTQGIKNLQDSAAYKKTAEGINVAKEKTAELWSSVTHSTSFQNMQRGVGSAFGAAKSRLSASISTHNVGEVLDHPPPTATATTTHSSSATEANGDKKGATAKAAAAEEKK